jgi:hypothetical protein
MENREANMPTQESKEGESRFNLLTNYDGTVAAIAEVEGEGWLYQNGKSDGNNTTGAVEHLKKLVDHGMLPGEEDEIVYQIYGGGGSTRWNVMGNGEIRFSKTHSWITPEKTRKSEELGFKIFE